MAISSYNPNQRGIFSFVRQIKPPKAGELREPIQFVRSKRIPKTGPQGENTDEFDQEFTPYARGWARVWQFQGSYLDDMNTECNLSHLFLIRREPEIKIESRTYAIWNSTLFIVRGTRSLEDIAKPFADGYKYLLVMCDEREPWGNERQLVNRDEGDVLGGPPAAIDPENPLWT